jgi:hypothetical protein
MESEARTGCREISWLTSPCAFALRINPYYRRIVRQLQEQRRKQGLPPLVCTLVYSVVNPFTSAPKGQLCRSYRTCIVRGTIFDVTWAGSRHLLQLIPHVRRHITYLGQDALQLSREPRSARAWTLAQSPTPSFTSAATNRSTETWSTSAISAAR